MADFNPDKFLAETAPKSGFDPDKFLSETAPIQRQAGFGERMTRAALNSLPTAGAVVGGVLGTPADMISGPVGTVVGAGLGAAAGKSLQNLGEKYLLGDEKSRSDIYAGPVKAAAEGAMFEMGGQAIGAIPSLVKSGVKSANDLITKKVGEGLEYTPIPNKDVVEAAAKKLDLPPVPKAVTNSNKTYQDLESGLSQSGSLPAKETRQQYEKFFKGLKDAGQKIADLKTPDSDFAIGSSIQKDLAQQVESNKAPVSEMYTDATKQLQQIPVNEQVVNKAFGSLKRNPLFQTKDGIQMLEDMKSSALSQPELNSLKEFRSSLGDSVSATAAPIEAKRMDAIRQALTSVRDNSINALKTDLPKDMHGEVDNLIDQISLADKAHASNIQDINSVKGIIGNKDFKSPTSFLNKLNDLKETDLAQKAANMDVTSLRNLQEKFPTVFEKARTAKINDMVSSSTNSVSGFNEAKFIKQYDGMDQEMKDLIFSPSMQDHIDSLKIVKQAIPEKLGPSGTPKGQMMMEAFSPRRNALDYGIKKALNASEQATVPEVASKVPEVKKSGAILQLFDGGGTKSVPTPTTSAPTAMPKAADNSQPTKGPEKWASDGAKKLQEHDSSIDPAIIEKLKSTKQGRDLLIQASDLKPNTKAMDAVVKKIRSSSLNGGE